MKPFVLLVASALVLTSCTSHTTKPTEPTPAKGERREAGIPIPLPKRVPSPEDVDPVSQRGEEMFITPSGFRPKALIAVVKAKLRFYNETNEPQTVRFTNSSWTSPPIRPGGYVTYTPNNVASIAFVVESRPKVLGYIDVQPWYPPEDERPGVPTATPSPR